MRTAATDRAQRAARVRGLYAVTPQTGDTAWLCERVRAAIAGGASTIQYRYKDLAPSLAREQALALAETCRAGGALLIVNDDPALARDADADGVHVGEDDAGIEQARAIVGEGRLVGASCYGDFGLAVRAAAAGADYLAFGSFFPSRTKPHARRADRSLLRRAHALGVPVVAIGGIDDTNAESLAEAGADAVAVVSAVFDGADAAATERAARALASAFRIAHPR